MEVTISQIEGVRFSVQARSHRITCDQPTENAGTDGGMTPPELLLASLGSCAAFYAAEYLRTRNLSTNGVQVSVTAEKMLKPARLSNFHVTVASPVTLTLDQHEAMMRTVQHCLVHNTLLTQPQIEIEIAVPVGIRQETVCSN